MTSRRNPSNDGESSPPRVRRMTSIFASAVSTGEASVSRNSGVLKVLTQHTFGDGDGEGCDFALGVIKDGLAFAFGFLPGLIEDSGAFRFGRLPGLGQELLAGGVRLTQNLGPTDLGLVDDLLTAGFERRALALGVPGSIERRVYILLARLDGLYDDRESVAGQHDEHHAEGERHPEQQSRFGLQKSHGTLRFAA